jgi:NitT/TauT family transport system substrate-binding protein
LRDGSAVRDYSLKAKWQPAIEADAPIAREQTMRTKAALVAILVTATVPGLAAAENVKVAVPIRGAWGTAYTEFGVKQGFFKAQGLDVDITYTEGGASNEQALISGSVNIAVATGYMGMLSAFTKGAPVRIISAEATGAPDMFWYAKASSGIKSLKDMHGKTIGFSNPGSSSNLILQTLLQENGVTDAKMVPIGAAPNGLPQVMTGQLAAAWSVPPTGLTELASKEIVIIAKGNDSDAVRNETVRVNAVNLDWFKDHRDTATKFLEAYAKSVDWAYSGAPAYQLFATMSGQSPDQVEYLVKTFQSPEQDQILHIKGTQRVLDEALAAKRIPKKMTQDEVKGAFDFLVPGETVM